jgi:uncharacterized protein YkwD
MTPPSHLIFAFIGVTLSLTLPFSALAYQVPEREYWRAYTLSLINASRVDHGLPLLGIDDELTNLSQIHANDSAVHYDDATAGSRRATYILHVSSDGRTLGDRVKDQGVTGASRFGENVGLRFSSGFRDVHAALEEAIRYMHDYMMAEVPPDDGHRVTILTPDYTHVGVGLELHKKAGEVPNTLFLVTDFAAFTDAREVVIPKVGKRPQWILPEAPPPTPSIPLRNRRVRERTIDRLKRRLLPPSESITTHPEKSLQKRAKERRLERLQKHR